MSSYSFVLEPNMYNIFMLHMVAHNSFEQPNNLRPMTPALPVRCDGLSSRLNWWVQMCSKGSGLTWARPEKIHSKEAYHMCGTFLGVTTTSATSEERWRLCMDVLPMCPNIGGWVAVYRFHFYGTVSSLCIPDTIQFAVRHQACFTLTPGKHETSRNILQQPCVQCKCQGTRLRGAPNFQIQCRKRLAFPALVVPLAAPQQSHSLQVQRQTRTVCCESAPSGQAQRFPSWPNMSLVLMRFYFNCLVSLPSIFNLQRVWTGHQPINREKQNFWFLEMSLPPSGSRIRCLEWSNFATSIYWYLVAEETSTWTQCAVMRHHENLRFMIQSRPLHHCFNWSQHGYMRDKCERSWWIPEYSSNML